MIWYLVILAFFFFFLNGLNKSSQNFACNGYQVHWSSLWNLPSSLLWKSKQHLLLPIFQHHSCLPEFLRLPATVPQPHLENLWYVREQSLGPCDLNTFRMDKGIVTHSSRILSFNYYFFHSAYHCVWVQTEAK